MPRFPKEQLDTQLAKLPPPLREALFSADVAEKTFDIGEKHGLNIEKIGFLAEEVGYVVLGLVAPRDFISALEKRLSTDADTTQKIASEINSQIFRPLRELLKQTHEVDVPAELIKKETVFRIPKPSTSGQDAVQKFAPIFPTPPAKVEEEKKPSQPQPQKTRPSSGIDPYREPIEDGKEMPFQPLPPIRSFGKSAFSAPQAAPPQPPPKQQTSPPPSFPKIPPIDLRAQEQQQRIRTTNRRLEEKQHLFDSEKSSSSLPQSIQRHISAIRPQPQKEQNSATETAVGQIRHVPEISRTPFKAQSSPPMPPARQTPSTPVPPPPPSPPKIPPINLKQRPTIQTPPPPPPQNTSEGASPALSPSHISQKNSGGVAQGPDTKNPVVRTMKSDVAHALKKPFATTEESKYDPYRETT